MKKTRTAIYVKATIEKNEVVYSGIEFAEFIRYLPNSIENLMIITGGCNVILVETEFERGFELFSGRDLVDKLSKQDIYNFGDFCFVDYASSHKTRELSEEQIAELLYLGHMFKPLRSPFFEVLQNRFAYLAHDDGFYCKLYCLDPIDFITVLCKKIQKNACWLNENICEPQNNIKEKILELAVGGLLMDVDELSHKDGSVSVKLYSVGEYSNMDDILNSFHQIKLNTSQVKKLICNAKEWVIS